DPHLVEQVRQLQEIGALECSPIGLAPEVANTVLALQKYHAAQVSAGNVRVEQIEVAFMLGNSHFNQFIVAISIGAVFFGANTYIGNGPNFMVKAIAEHQKIRTPGFFGFLFKYAVPCLGPLLVLIWLLFFRTS